MIVTQDSLSCRFPVPYRFRQHNIDVTTEAQMGARGADGGYLAGRRPMRWSVSFRHQRPSSRNECPSTVANLNNEIQSLIKQACGYRNKKRFRADLFLHSGGLVRHPSPQKTGRRRKNQFIKLSKPLNIKN